MLIPALWPLLGIGAIALIAGGVLTYLGRKYGPVIGRIFEASPMFLPVQARPLAGGEEVRFPTEDGLSLAGSYFRCVSGRRLGIVVFCHEFLGNRHSVHHYADGLRDLGFDLFAFDFRNHGESDSEPGHEPLQWVSDRDSTDLRSALAYLRTRPDADPAGAGLFGVSRGGGVALVVAAEDPRVWAVVTDGAFPTRGTTLAYILRWAEIYVRTPWIRRMIPVSVYRYVGWVARRRSERRLDRRFPNLERAVRWLTPRPWLAIHGAQDNYIGPEIARELFRQAGDPKRFWLVEAAKHNRCREMAGSIYDRTVGDWFLQSAPRSPRTSAQDSRDAEGNLDGEPAASERLAVAIPGSR